MSKKMTPLQQAIADKDEYMVALLWRNDQIAEELERRIAPPEDPQEDDILAVAGGLSPTELILSIVKPSDEIRERSLEKARALIEAGPFAQQPVQCERHGCEERFLPRSGFGPGRNRRFCSDHCRKLHNSRTVEMPKRRAAAQARREANLARGWEYLKELKCAGGHERTKKNTYLDTKGARRCSDCLRHAGLTGMASGRRRRRAATGTAGRPKTRTSTGGVVVS